MKYKTITISESIQLNDGHWRKVEWSAELDTNETPETITTEIKDRILNWFEENRIQNPMQQPREEQPIDPIQSWIDEINSYTTLEQIEKVKYLQNSSKPQIKQAYENKRKELTQ